MTSEMQRLVDLDWLDPWPDGVLLHHAVLPAGDQFDDETCWVSLHLACGWTPRTVCTPGVVARMSARRCGACCDIRGLPRGKGSPKNDVACRLLLGLARPRRWGTPNIEVGP